MAESKFTSIHLVVAGLLFSVRSLVSLISRSWFVYFYSFTEELERPSHLSVVVNFTCTVFTRPFPLPLFNSYAA